MRGILFDLDGTLLDIDLGAFLERYFDALGHAMTEILPPENVGSALQAVGEATDAMMRPHPGRTNQEVFYEDYLHRTGVDLREHWAVFERFYEERFPHLGDGTKPAVGGEAALAAAEASGLAIAIATNPIFPRRAVEHRLAWAGVGAARAQVITTYECMHACKPYREYFLETAAMLGVEPRDCLMVGDDPVLDMSAADVGMLTFYVGPGTPGHADYVGTLADLPGLLERLAAENE